MRDFSIESGLWCREDVGRRVGWTEAGWRLQLDAAWVRRGCRLEHEYCQVLPPPIQAPGTGTRHGCAPLSAHPRSGGDSIGSRPACNPLMCRSPRGHLPVRLQASRPPTGPSLKASGDTSSSALSAQQPSLALNAGIFSFSASKTAQASAVTFVEIEPVPASTLLFRALAVAAYIAMCSSPFRWLHIARAFHCRSVTPQLDSPYKR